MTHLPVKRFAFVLIFLVITLACGRTAVNTEPSPTAPSAADTTPENSYPEELTIERDVTFGPGPFDYTDPRTGLSDLSSYQATLTLSFDGTRDGQAQKWSKTYTMLTTRDPQARQLTIEQTDSSSQPEPVFLAEMDGLDYERRGENACNAAAIQEGDSLGERLEPASFLTGVIGAEVSGSETVNGVASTRYFFDQHALGEQDLTEAIADIWIASEGNYIVKYLLTRKGKADYFGEGIEGTLTLDYELSDPTQPVTIALPEDCPPGMVDAPLLQDATNATKAPGLLSYETTTALKDAVAFYQEQIPGLGWTVEGDASITDSAAVLNYKKGNQAMTVILSAGDHGTTVQILLENVQK